MTGRKSISFAAAVLGCILVVGQARAAGPATPSSTDRSREGAELVAREHPTRKVFYGWQILATGEAGAAVVAASVFLPSKPLDSFFSSGGFVIGMPTYLLAGPVIHWSHDNFQKGLISFASNSAFALIGGFVGKSVRCSGNDVPDCGSTAFFRGVGVGALVAPLLDSVILGWEYVPVEDVVNGEVASRAKRSPTSAFAWAPTWAMGPRGSFSLGVAGRF
jgi:hypothetical protein